MSEWDGRERRQSPHEYGDMLKRVEIIEKKLAQWETGAWVFRWFVIATAATLTAAAGVLDWMKEHLK